MKYQKTTRFGCLVAAGILISGITAHSAPADVSDWVGLNNTASNNNYVGISDTSVGGNLMARLSSGAYLADTSLAGGPITGSYQAYGSLTFDARISGAAIVDPVVVIGFFNTATFPNPTSSAERGGFAFADSSATAFRLQMAAPGTQSTVAEGSYEFRMEYDTAWSALGNLRVAFYASGADVFTATALHNISGARPSTTLNAFGIYQPSSASVPNDIWLLTLANLHYTGMTPVTEPAAAQSPGVNYPAKDALGRALPTYEEVGDIRPGKKVAMFYWTWHSGHSQNSKAYDLSKIITDPAMINDYFHPNWDPYKDGGAFHWGEPLFDYYDGMDKWVIRKQLEMLGAAGVDVLFFDATNGSETWKNGYEAVGQVMEEMRAQGVAVPQFAFMLNFSPQRSAAEALVQLYDDLYSINKYQDSWFMWNGKPVVMAYPEVCDTTYPSDTAGMKFSAGSAFTGIRVKCTSWGNAIGDLTLSLYAWDNNSYASSVAQSPLARKAFTNFADNAWLTLTFTQRPAGDYVWELSDAREEVGVWKYPEETAGITSYFNGSPVSGDYQTEIRMVGGSVSNLTSGNSGNAVRLEAGVDPVKQGLVKNVFTFRPGQSSYVGGPQRNDQWGWLENAPQHGYVHKGGGQYELVTVGVGQNWSEQTGAISAMNGPNIRGRSFTTVDRFSKLTTNSYLYGYNFQEQWNRALQVDPDMVFITGWNEWVAGRFQSWQGVSNAFPDQFNVEYSRDIEPMKGGFGDNYYYQMIANIRKFKGMEPPPAVSGPMAIAIDGVFSDWTDVTPHFRVSQGNVQLRDGYGYKHPSTGLPIHYTNNTARNDIIGAKLARDGFNICFYVQTATNLTSHTDPNWMQLLIDADRNKATGWEGYDLMVDRYAADGKAMLSTSSGGWNWTDLSEVDYRVAGAEMEIAIPRVLLNLPPGQPLDLEFKWLDSPTSSGDIMAVYTDGEAAPSARFNFRYRVDAQAAQSLRIMPMGDSITAGFGVENGAKGGWRAPLYTNLQNGGYTFDFVGSKTTAGDTCPDTNHWGAAGWQISDTPATIDGRSYVSIQGQNRSGLYDEMSDAISTTYFSTNGATTRNIVLLQIGINDVLHQVVDSAHGSYNSDAGNDGQGEGQEWIAEGNTARLQALLESIDNFAASRNLQIEVILGNLCPLTTAWTGDAVSSVLTNEVMQYNGSISSVIPTLVFSNISVKIVDQYTATVGKLADGLHPNSAGYAAMAQVWCNAISNTGGGTPSGTVTETFDTATTTAAHGWTGSNNTTGGNNFGWSNTSNVLGGANAGEAGGTFARSVAYRTFADINIGTFSRTNTLRMLGSFTLTNQDFNGIFQLGYFKTGAVSNNFVGITIVEPASGGSTPFRGFAGVNGTGGAGTGVINLVQNTTLTFDLTWTGNANGSGTLSGTLVGTSVNVTGGAGTGTFDAFGLVCGGNSDNNSAQNTGGCYFDNLTYTKVGVNTTSSIVSYAYDSGAHTMTLTFAGTPGTRYRVQSATTLTPPANWMDLSTNTAPPGGLWQLVNPVGSTNRFYRTVYP